LTHARARARAENDQTDFDHSSDSMKAVVAAEEEIRRLMVKLMMFEEDMDELMIMTNRMTRS